MSFTQPESVALLGVPHLTYSFLKLYNVETYYIILIAFESPIIQTPEF